MKGKMVSEVHKVKVNLNESMNNETNVEFQVKTRRKSKKNLAASSIEKKPICSFTIDWLSFMLKKSTAEKLIGILLRSTQWWKQSKSKET